MRIGTGKRIGEAVTPGHVCIYGRTRKAKCFGYLFDTYPLLGIRCGLGATAMASYHFYISRLPVTLRYQVSLPVIGTFFSPEFGQSYYEMFGIGNCSGIVHFGAWHNRVDVRNYISVDLHVGKRALRLGYRQVMRTTHINSIDTQVLTHTFVLGISGEIFRAAPSDRRIVSVYY